MSLTRKLATSALLLLATSFNQPPISETETIEKPKSPETQLTQEQKEDLKNKGYRKASKEEAKDSKPSNTKLLEIVNNIEERIEERIEEKRGGKVYYVQGNYLTQGGYLWRSKEKDVKVNGTTYDRLRSFYLAPNENNEKNKFHAHLILMYKAKDKFLGLPTKLKTYAILDGGIENHADGKPDYFIDRSLKLYEILKLFPEVKKGKFTAAFKKGTKLSKKADKTTLKVYNEVNSLLAQ